jgi:hypothetical protein
MFQATAFFNVSAIFGCGFFLDVPQFVFARLVLISVYCNLLLKAANYATELATQELHYK